MEKENVYLDWLKNNWQTTLNVAFVVLLMLTVFTCNNKDADLGIAKKDLKNTEEKAKEKINALAEQNKNKDNQITNYKTEVKSLYFRIGEISTQKIIVANDTKTKKEQAKVFTNPQKVGYFVNRYELPSDVLSTQKGLELSDKVASLTINDLIVGDGAIKELDLTSQELNLTKQVVTQKDNIISAHESKEVNFNLMLNQKDTIIDAQKDYAKQVEKSLKSERRKKNLWKATTIAVIAGATYLIAK